MAATIACPHCGSEDATVYVNAPAVVETVQIVGAEVSVADLNDVKTAENGDRYLPLFRLDDRLETVDAALDWHTLELDAEDTAHYCMNCNGIVTDEFRALLNAAPVAPRGAI